ncbi:E3 UFM1-protein ligase 1 [Trichomycterus rosablanca]|uniref:E3 UFM1-protein ligase 1 n=1 Tax=Trichomycterus rosablanca TaxID=2290929 RepID=UPI002F3592F6
MADWEEIRRLAADFHRVQFTESVLRLSERNCIELISKLVEEKKLDVIYTLDGKELITPSHICKEIRDELYTHGGRINIVDLQKIINVDLVHVESRANEVAKSDRGTQIILGQLINEQYLDQLCEEVNDKLQESGQVNITELSKTHQLPAEFLTQELTLRLNRLIDGRIDQFNGLIFTQNFINRQKAKIRGLFTSISRPTPVNTLIGQFGLQENLLYSLLEELVNLGRVNGSVVGGRQDKAVFVPDVYCRAQSAWVQSFLTHNSYLEFEALTRLGIPDPVNYIKKRFKDKKLVFLKSACVESAILDQLEASVEEAVTSDTWIDLQPLLPSCLSDDDTAMLIDHVMRSVHAQSSARVLGTSVVTEKFISSCIALFGNIMQQKAQTEMKNDPVMLLTEDDVKLSSVTMESSGVKREKREERRKKVTEGSGSIRTGGGGNAREIRTRKTKKKNRKNDDSDDETPTTRNKQVEVFLSVDEIMEVLEEKVCDCPDETLQLIAQELVRPLSKAYQDVVRSVFQSSSSSSASAGKRRQTAKELQEEMNTLYTNIRVLEKSIKHFSDDVQVHIVKHILKSVCTDLTNTLINFLSSDHMITIDDPNTITAEFRLKILTKLPDEIKAPLMKLNTSLNGKSIEDFLCSVEAAAEDCGVLLKKGDKKREKQVMMVHKNSLMEQLKAADDEALVLHLSVLLMFQQHMHCMLLAPGRCVSNIIYTLQSKIPQEQYQLLAQYHSLVVKRLVEKKTEQVEGESDGSDELKEIQRLRTDMKELVLSSRKMSTTEQ